MILAGEFDQESNFPRAGNEPQISAISQIQAEAQLGI
jgi:hypothetical protein